MDIGRQVRVHEAVALRAASQPDRLAVIHGDETVTYAELDRRANGLAAHLTGTGVAAGDVVVVHRERSVETVVSLLAVWKAWAAYLPVEPGTAVGRISSFLAETGARTVIAAEDDLPRLGGLPVTVVPAGAGGERDDPPAAGDGAVAYVIYTSGSTGRPKGVAVDHDALGHLCATLVDRYGIGPADRVLQFGALSFDTSIEQMVVALAGGAALVLPDRPWAPSELGGRLRGHGVTVADLTPAYWRAFLARCDRRPVDLPVRLVIVGGETVTSADCRSALALMPDARLVNAYGLTETTITSCLAEITEDVLPDRGPAPVGRPLPGTVVHVLDDRGRPVEPGGYGEIYIGGRGLATPVRGHSERLLPDPFAAAAGARMYRTGDLGTWTPAGDLQVVGRVDRQVKVRGFRVEPAEVEATLAAHDGVDDVAVTAHPTDTDRGLAAYYTARTPLASGELRAFAGHHLPDHMVPSAFVPVEELPLTVNGKVDIDALPDAGRAAAEPAGGEQPARPMVTDLLERTVSLLWRQTLGVDHARPADDFFAAGGDSILATELVASARSSFGLLVDQVRPLTRRLVEDGSLGAFTDAVRLARAGGLGDDRAGAGTAFAEDCRLDVPISRRTTGPRGSDPRTVLLTGATGFLGVYLLRELLTTTAAVVHCLVRAPDAETGAARIRANAAHYFGDDLREFGAEGRIVAVPGDLAEPGLGLSDETFDRLARTVDVIHHPGGRVNFVYPYSQLRPANVDGTREIIRLAARHRNVPVHYVSTMAVVAGYGVAGVRHVDETTPLGHADRLSVGYVESKWVAEALLQDAARAGLPVAIHRAADISGDRVGGAWNTATEMCALKRVVVDTGTAPVAELPLDYTPVDVFAAAVAHIAATTTPAGEVYHLTNPGKVNISALVERLRAHGHRIREIAWDAWVDEVLRVAVESPAHPMTPFAPLFIDRCAGGGMSVAEMYLEDTFPEFSRSNVEAALRGSGIEIPPVDAAMLDRYIGYLTAIDFLGVA